MVKTHEENPIFTKDLIERSLAVLKVLLAEGALHRLKLLLRFYANLTHLNYFSAQVFSSIIASFLRFSKNEPSEFFLYLLTSTIIHAGTCILPNTLQEFMTLASIPRDIEKKSILRVFSGQSQDILDALIRGLESMSISGWPLPKVLQIQQPLSESVSFEFPEDLSPSEKCIFFSPLVIDLLNLGTDSIQLHEQVSETIFAFKDNLELLSQKLEDFNSPEVLVNCVLSELLNLGSKSNLPVFYSSLLTKLSKVMNPPNVVDAKLNEALHQVLSLIDTFDVTSLESLETFLAHYISNLSFCWNWELFNERPLTQNQELFLRKLLAKTVRLSYHDMVKSELPENLHRFLTPEPEPVLRFSEIEESVDNTDSQLIIDRINSKASTQAMKALLASKEICNSGEFLMTIFCETLFYQGAKSLQHISIYLERYLEILTGVAPNKILTSLSTVWQKSPQRIELLVSKLLGHKLISSEDLASFCLERLQKPDSWNDLHSLEWTLLEIAVQEAKSQKFEVIEFICRGCTSISHEKHIKKLTGLLRKFINIIEEQQLHVIESTLPESLSKELRKLSKLVVR